MAASFRHPDWDETCNPGICSNQELNLQPFGSWMVRQTTEPHWPGLSRAFEILYLNTCHQFGSYNTLQKFSIGLDTS